MGRNSKRDWSKLFGRYEPPEWMHDKSLIKAFFKQNKALVRKCVLALLGICALVVAVCFVCRYVRSKIPVKVEIGYSFTTPDLAPEGDKTLTVHFTGSAAKLEDIGKPVTAPIRIEPVVAGSWQWEDEATLRFTPAEDWQLGTRYTVRFPRYFFPSHIKPAASQGYSSQFTTTEFQLDFDRMPEYVVDDYDPAKKYITCTLSANFPLAQDCLEGKVHFEPKMEHGKNGTFEKRSYAATVGYSEDRKTVYIASEQLGMPATPVIVLLSIDAGAKSALGGNASKALQKEVTVPGMTDFVQVSDADLVLAKNEKEEYEQVFAFTVTARSKTEDFAAGLEMWQLPKDKPQEGKHKEEKDVDWTDYSPSAVTALVLQQSQKLSPLAFATEDTFSKRQSFRYHAEPGSYVYVRLRAGTRFYGGYYLADDFTCIRRVPDYPKEVSILSDGDILSMQGSHQISVLSRGVTELEFSIWRMKSDQINHIVSQSNGNMRNFRFLHSYYFDENSVSELYKSTRTVEAATPEKPVYTSFDFSDYLGELPEKSLRHGLFLFRCMEKGGNSYAADSRLILITDQGLIVKRASDGSNDIFVQSISSGRPVSGSLISIVGRNGAVVSSAVTASDGHVHLPSLKTNAETLSPVAITAVIGNDFAFVPYQLGDRELDYSNFETGGEYGSANPDALHAYIFSDRGIYRPGDKAHFGVIVKAGSWLKNIGALPCLYSVTDPNGTLVTEKEFTITESGFNELSFETKPSAVTGEYTLTLYVKKIETRSWHREYLESKNFSIEEFQPDTLAITADIAPHPAVGWIHADAVQARVSLKNLFGTPAVGNTVKANMQLTPGYLSFPQYKGYRFLDPLCSENSYKETLAPAVTDESGNVSFALDVQKFARASYRLLFTADGFEKESGRSVTAQAAVYVSPLDYLVGVKADGDLSFINRDTKRTLSLIAVGANGDACNAENLQLVLYENRYVSALIKEPNGVYRYHSVKKEFPKEKHPLTIPKEGLQIILPTTEEGDFVLAVCDADGNKFCDTAFSVIGSKNVQRSLSRTAELELKTEKTDFTHGETVQLFIKAPYAGSGLIAVERDKVYSYQWFESDGDASVQQVTIPHGIEGNGYITVMYARKADSPEIYMSPFCYAALPFSVSLENRVNALSVIVPQEAKPDSDFTIRYSSAKPGRALLFAVDEGILQVAKYKTPDPLAYFFKKRALEVDTAQLLDLVLPEYTVLKKLGAAGGGEDYDLLSNNLNPFKRKQNAPVVYWSGIVDCDSTERTVSYHIPDYFNGSLRVMALVVSDDALGVYSSNTEVKGDYIIAPNAPLFASPGDCFAVPVTVTNCTNVLGDTFVLSAQGSAALSVESAPSVTLTAAKGKDATAVFMVKASETLGNATLTFTVSGAASAAAGDKARATKLTSVAALSIRPSMPYQVWLSTGVLGAGASGEAKTATVDVSRALYSEYATRALSVSYLPIGLAKGLEFYLHTYPYGCSEQVTSAAYPYLFSELQKDSGKTRQDAQEAVDNVVGLLAARQRSDGAIGYWTNKSCSWAVLDAYCALFFTDAIDRGFYVPQSMLQRLLGALKAHAADSKESAYSRAFCIYVLTRNEIVTTSYLESLKKDMDKDERMSAASMFMAASYKLLQLDGEGEKLVARVKKDAPRADVVQHFEDELFFQSVYLYVLSRYYPASLSSLAPDVLSAMQTELLHNRYASFSASFALMALESYMESLPATVGGKASAVQRFADGKTEPLTFAGNRIFTSDFAESAKSLLVQQNEKRSLFYQVMQAGFERAIPAADVKNGIEVYREYTDANGKPLTQARVGDIVTVKVSVRSLPLQGEASAAERQNVAVVDLFPSCLEADIDSVRAQNDKVLALWKPDSVDIREDRLVLYGSAAASVQTFTYKARVITSGSFVVPPLFAESMYDKRIKALRRQDPLTVARD